MILTQPLALLGLLSLPAILALHLLRKRNRRYPVSSLKLWSFAQPEVHGSRPAQIPVTFLLLLDLFIAVLLTAAMAGIKIYHPVTAKAPRQMAILIDVSNSMRARDVTPDRLAQAKLEAQFLIGTIAKVDSLCVVTFGSDVRLVGDTHQVPLDDIAVKTEALQAGEIGHALPEALAFARSRFQPDQPVEIHVFTDAAFPISPDLISQERVHLHVMGSGANNQAVVGLSAVPVGENQTQVFAQIANFGDAEVHRTVSLLADQKQVDSADMVIPAHASISQNWNMIGRPKTVTAAMAGEDLLSEDDQASLPIRAVQTLDIGVVGEADPALIRALKAMPSAALRQINPSEYQAGMPFDLTIFSRFLPGAWPEGMALVIEPPPGKPLLPLGDQKEPVEAPEVSASPLFDGIDLTGVKWGGAFPAASLPTELRVLLGKKDIPVLLEGDIQKTHLVVLNLELGSGNFVSHPAFPLLIANILDAARKDPIPLMALPGTRLDLSAKFVQVEVHSPSGKNATWWTDKPVGGQDFFDPGLYWWKATARSGRVTNAWMAVNAGDLAESAVRPQVTQPGAPGYTPDPSSVVEAWLDLTAWILTLAVLCLLVEARLAWR